MSRTWYVSFVPTGLDLLLDTVDGSIWVSLNAESTAASMLPTCGGRGGCEGAESENSEAPFEIEFMTELSFNESLSEISKILLKCFTWLGSKNMGVQYFTFDKD